jgi:hypothetical protein
LKISDITISNVKAFLQGTIREYYYRYNEMPKFLQEQIALRNDKCKDDCVKTGKCKECGCSIPGKWFVTKTCNKDRFPDLMEQDDWIKFKINNNGK